MIHDRMTTFIEPRVQRSLSAIHARSSGRPLFSNLLEIAEVDRGAWFSLAQAVQSIRQEQQPLLQRLEKAFH